MTEPRPTILVNGRAGAPQPRARVEQLHQLVAALGHEADLVITRSEAEMQAHLHRLVMVYRPGGYKFSDHLKLGVPLDILMGLVVVAIAPFIWPF